VVNCGGVLIATATHQQVRTSFDAIREFCFGRSKALKEGVDLIKSIRLQYDTQESLDFYSVVMGDNTESGGSIHYGLYTETNTMAEASVASLHRLLRDQPRGLKVLEIGSGTGFASHVMAKEYGHHVTAVNICPGQNQWNRDGACKLGVGDLVDVELMSFERLPVEWTNQFDMVFSQESSESMRCCLWSVLTVLACAVVGVGVVPSQC
jgi:cyclopropane fatty-acyl-phospholipid synthase-like methyltransferase